MKYNKKFMQISIACVLVLGICVVTWFIFYENTHAYQKKSWAETMSIDPAKEYPVTYVVDGDTFKTMVDGHEITVRMLGMNTPEVVDPRKPVECYGREASAETKSLLIGKNVRLALNPDYERIDKYGRLLAYVHLDGQNGDIFLNEYLVKEGFAREYTFNFKNPYQYQKLFQKDEIQAKKDGKGLWGKCIDNVQKNDTTK